MVAEDARAPTRPVVRRAEHRRPRPCRRRLAMADDQRNDVARRSRGDRRRSTRHRARRACAPSHPTTHMAERCSPPSPPPSPATKTPGTPPSRLAVEHRLRLIAVDALEGLAVAAARTESWAECLRLLAAGQRLRDELDYRWRFPIRAGRGRRRPPARHRQPRRRRRRAGKHRRTEPRLAGGRRLRPPGTRRAETTAPRLGQPHPDRTASRRPHRRRPHQRPNRGPTPHGPSHRQDASRPHLQQARSHHPRPTRRRSRPPDSELIRQN